MLQRVSETANDVVAVGAVAVRTAVQSTEAIDNGDSYAQWPPKHAGATCLSHTVRRTWAPRPRLEARRPQRTAGGGRRNRDE
jgi:hypothetical protein